MFLWITGKRQKVDEIKSEVTESILQKIGDNPYDNKRIATNVNTGIMAIYSAFMLKGLKEETTRELAEKYEIPESYQIPAINDCLTRKMSATALAKDKYRLEAQSDMANSLTLTTALLSRLNDATESIDPEEFESMLIDSAKYQASAIYKESISRRAFIMPGFPSIRSTLEKTSIDNKFLFGVGLEKAIEGNELVNPQTQALKQLTNAIQQKGNFLGRKKWTEKSSRGGSQHSSARGGARQPLLLKRRNSYQNSRAGRSDRQNNRENGEQNRRRPLPK